MTDTTDGAALTAAVERSPLDWRARLVLADWFDDDGHEHTADYLRRIADALRSGSITPGPSGAVLLAKIRKALRYRGRKVRAEFALSVVMCDVEWGGGTRNHYVHHSIADGGALFVPPIREGAEADVRIGAPLVERSFFQGKDCGVRAYVHPADAAYFIR